MNMKKTNPAILAVYKRCQQGDTSARKELVEHHKKKFPRHSIHASKENFDTMLSSNGAPKFYHMLYLHLT